MKKLFAASLILIAIICFSFQKKENHTILSTPSVLRDSLPVMEGDGEWSYKDDNQSLYIRFKDGKMTQLKIDGKEIPSNDFDQYQDRINDIASNIHNHVEPNLTEIHVEMGDLDEKLGELSADLNGIAEVEDLISESKNFSINSDLIGESKNFSINSDLIGDMNLDRDNKAFTKLLFELKKDGLLQLGEKSTVIMDDVSLIVNHKIIDNSNFLRYKKIVEKHLEKTLNDSFSFFLKGVIEVLDEDRFTFTGRIGSF
jgi:hypothetical protein